jgi:ribonuclease G
VISSNRHETRVAVLEDDQVVEVFYQRENEYSLAGSIHKGRVTRVLPGMQSAFVDIGLGRDAFLYVSDFFEDNDEYDKIVTSVEEKVLKLDRTPGPLVQAAPVEAVPDAEETPAADAVAEPVDVVPPAPLSPPASAMQGPPGFQGNRRDRGPDRGGDQGGGDRRGRRSRRGRGQRSGGGPGGRGLPDAKYYSPRPDNESRYQPSLAAGIPEAAPVEESLPRVVFDPSQDDFFVLPGESLAKYTGHAEDEPENNLRDPASRELQAVDDVMAEAAYDADHDLEGATKRMLDAAAEAAEAEEPVVEPAEAVADGSEETRPQAVVHRGDSRLKPAPPTQASDLPLVAQAVSPANEIPQADIGRLKPAPPMQASDLPVVAQAVSPANNIPQADIGRLKPAPPMQASDLPVVAQAVSPANDIPSAAAPVAERLEEEMAPVQESAGTQPESPQEGESEAADAAEVADSEGFANPAEDEARADVEGAEPAAEGESTGDEAAVAVMEDEGPEPARIPTSLTATLREQGGRYPHRVSRRTRRKGRGDRGPAPEGQRGPQGESRPLEQGTSERTVQRPESRPEGRSDSRPEARPDTRADKIALPSISDLLKEGQEIIVQIAKEPLGQKGARITSHIALPGRFLVYMPTVDHIGVSRKIPSDEERLRLKRILQANRTGISGGYIVRTAGEGRSEEELRADMMFLYNLWLDMRQKAERRPAPVLIHHDLNVVERILRDQLTVAYKSVWVDNEEAYENVLRFVERFQPALVSRVKMYTRSTPIFDEFGITAELEKALRPKVWLKSGGHIVINQTEALVAIDINTGKYVGKSNRLEDTIVKTNTDAIKEIVRQIRLRDLGGIIVVDFIDMDERKNRQKVMQALEEAMRADRAPYKILQFNDFGLVAITRKRVKQSLERTLCTPCSYCEGAGYVKSPQTVVSEILVEAQKIARAVDTKDVMLRVSPEVAKLLKSNQNTYLQEIEEILNKPVIVKSDPLLHQEKFDLA